MSAPEFAALEQEIRACRLCAHELQLGPRPVLQISPQARLLIAGQAPGRRVHESGVPFQDASGDRLREWLGIDAGVFYDASRVAIVPMGFCFPGTGSTGDLPPRPECASAWRGRVLDRLRGVRLTVVIGQYAIAWHLAERAKGTLTDTVKAWREFRPEVWPLPHPSPRNNIWLRKNPWFGLEVLPELRSQVALALS